MGNERSEISSSKKSSTPVGIKLRETTKGTQSIQIAFSFRGVECRESLRMNHSVANIRYCERLRGEILRAIELGTFNYQEYFPDSNRAQLFGHVVSRVTIGERLNDFLKQAERTLERSTFIGYKKSVKHHLLPRFGKMRFRDLSPAELRAWISGLDCTLKTIRNILTPLRHVILEALNDDLLDSNPLDKVAIDKLIDKERARSDYEVDPFDAEERAAIFSAAEGQARNLFQFAFYSGLRTSELIALEWGDIDWLHGTVRVQRAVVAKEEKRRTKTKSGTRDVLLLPPALAALEAQKQFTFLANSRIFHNPRTGMPWETDQQIRKTCWVYLLKKAGVRYRNPYQTRHTYASMLLSAGENMMWVAGQMGHVDTEMIIRNYGRWIPDRNEKAGYRPIANWSTDTPEFAQNSHKKTA